MNKILRFIPIFLLGVMMCACDHVHVMTEYKNGNPHARDLLLHGFNMKNSEYISTHLINRALDGDEEAKTIIYSQIKSLGPIQQSNTHYIPIVIPVRARR